MSDQIKYLVNITPNAVANIKEIVSAPRYLVFNR